MEEYTLIRSNRRTVALQLKNDGSVLVRAPLTMSAERIAEFVEKNAAWLERTRAKQAARRLTHPEPTEQEREELIRKAK